jgi:fluoride exporter
LPVHTTSQITLVAIGSALGGVARWGTSLLFGCLAGTSFTWGTLFINLPGSMFLGWFATLLANRWTGTDVAGLRADDLLLLVAVGFAGAYTTLSTYEFEANELLSGGRFWASAAYAGGSLFLGLLAVRAGIALART